jgi:4-aminobutyrate aminotransferase/(S)-3-amino-2-methylpropionate transaminase
MGAIVRKTEIPGPKSRAVLDRRAAAVTSSLARATDVVIESGRGALVTDVDGNTFIDFAGGIGMLATGHCPPSVVHAIQEQAERLIHPCALVATYEPYVALCEALNRIMPGDFPKKTLLANSGAEAVENAVKTARAFTKRQAVLCFEAAYHGRTLFTLSLTSKYGLFKQNLGPFAPEVYRVPAPDLYRRPAGMAEDAYVQWCCDQLEHALVAQVDPQALAAIVIEPVQGEGGFIPMPPAFLRKIRELCTKHGMVMIADEVQSGFGRTGTLFAVEHAGVVPDVVATAKSLGAGTPISATTGRADIMDATHPGGAGGTYGGSPLTCVAALEAIRLISEPAFLAHAQHIGDILRGELESWRTWSRHVGDVRGLGPMLVIELVRDRERKTPAPELTIMAIKRAVQHGVVVMRAGLYSNCIRFLPPLVISEAELREGLAVVKEALQWAEAVAS